jgi:hypothetical protein
VILSVAAAVSGCTHHITDFGATRYRFRAAVVGIVDSGPPWHFNISLFRSLFPDDLDDVHSILLLLGATLSASEPQTGIEGVITVGPANGGPARIGIPGSKPLANATFLAQNEKGIATPFTTDDQGYFRVPLEPGHYIVSLKDKKGGIGHYGPFEVDVVADRMTKVEWRCDTGIR